MHRRHLLVLVAVLSAAAALPACASRKRPSASPAAVAASDTAATGETAKGYYREAYRDGRYYVFGKPATEEGFGQSGHIPYCRTLIGGGPGGSTVVIEIDTKDEALADRLESEFHRRNGTN